MLKHLERLNCGMASLTPGIYMDDFRDYLVLTEKQK
jgi:hypothetical protein